MAEINKSRTIRPSSRLETSTSYKINVENISVNDTLVVTIDHESESFKKVDHFSGKQLQGRRSIHFKIDGEDIIWSSVTPE